MRAIAVALSATTLALVVGCQPRSIEPEPTAPAPPPTPVRDGAPRRVYECPRVAGEVRVDGVLEAGVWDVVPDTGAFALWSGEEATYDTRAKLVWDDKHLYLAVSCEDPDVEPGEMRERDQNLWEENEVVELFADANGDGRCYLEFEINPAGTVLDLLIPEAGAPGPLFGRKCWDAKGMESAVMAIPTTTDLSGDLGWEVEMAIPLECFLDAPNVPPKPGDEWRMNLYRVDTDSAGEKVEYQAWSPTNTDEPSFHVPERFGILRFAETAPGAGGSATESS